MTKSLVVTIGALTAIWLLADIQCAATPLEPNDDKTTTPIKHVIIIVGENRSFDHVFGTYVPKPGQTIFNLLSEKIVNEEGMVLC